VAAKLAHGLFQRRRTMATLSAQRQTPSDVRQRRHGLISATPPPADAFPTRRPRRAQRHLDAVLSPSSSTSGGAHADDGHPDQLGQPLLQLFLS